MRLCAISKKNWKTKTRCLLSISAMSMTPLAKCPMFHVLPFSCQYWMISALHSVLQWNSRTTANGSLGMMIIRYSPRKDTEVYVKKTDTGLLLHYQSHVDEKYKHSLMKTRWKRTFKLSSSWMFFHQECELLKKRFFSPALSWNSRREYHQTFYWNESHWGCTY